MASIEIQHGAEVELKFNPAEDYKFSKEHSDIGQNPWTMTGDKEVTVVFIKKWSEIPGHPFDIPDAWWNNVLQQGVRDFLRYPEEEARNHEDNDTIIFGFKGWFNDDGLIRGSDDSHYARQVAELVNLDSEYYTTSSCLINVHWVGPSGTATNKSYDSIRDKIENWGPHGSHSLGVNVKGQGTVGVLVNGEKATTVS